MVPYLCLRTTLGNVNDSPVGVPPLPLPSIFCARLLGDRAVAAAAAAVAIAARPSMPPP